MNQSAKLEGVKDKKALEQQIEEKEDRLCEIGIEAKALEREICELRRDIRAAERQARDNDPCTCGHIRKEHGKSFSINYTDGACGVKKCKCRNYSRK